MRNPAHEEDINACTTSDAISCFYKFDAFTSKYNLPVNSFLRRGVIMCHLGGHFLPLAIIS